MSKAKKVTETKAPHFIVGVIKGNEKALLYYNHEIKQFTAFEQPPVDDAQYHCTDKHLKEAKANAAMYYPFLTVSSK